MKSSWLGIFIAVGVLYYGVFRSAPNPQIFLDAHALILVIGGTLAVSLIAFPFRKFEDIIALLLFSVLKKRKSSLLNQAKDLVNLSLQKKLNQPLMITKSEKHPFMKEACYLLSHDHLSAEQLRSVLTKRSEFFKKKYLSDAKVLNAIGKFPPAFGLLGASTGMISMMSNIGQGQQDKIGDAMAIALVATFWGIAMANFILLPLADFASRIVLEDQHVRNMIIEAVVLIRDDEDPRYVMEKVLAFLPPHYRKELEVMTSHLNQMAQKPSSTTVIPLNLKINKG